MSKQVVIFSTNNCAKCMMTKNVFKRNGVEFQEINVSEEQNVNYLDELKAQGHSAMPVVRVIENDQITDEWVGFRDDKIKQHS